MQVSNDVIDQPILDANLQDAIFDDMAKNEQARNMSKWLVQTLRDSKLDVPMSSHTHSACLLCTRLLCFCCF